MPALETPISELITSFITDLNEQKPYAAPVIVIRCVISATDLVFIVFINCSSKVSSCVTWMD